MAAGIVVPITGPYTGTWNALALGTQDENGFELQCNFRGQEINATDAYGQTLVEGIYRGQDWRLRLTGLEWDKTGLLGALQTFGQVGAVTTLTPKLASIGQRWSSFSQVLILTAILGNPPCIPQTLTASSAVVAPNSESRFNLTSQARRFPLEMVLLPYSSTVSAVTSIIPFTTT